MIRLQLLRIIDGDSSMAREDVPLLDTVSLRLHLCERKREETSARAELCTERDYEWVVQSVGRP